jgi:two-component system phosphate regulon sensor histidine kinase PhoR
MSRPSSAPSRFSGIRWRIAVPYILLIVAVMAGLAVYLSGRVRQFYLADLQGQLAGEARVVGEALLPLLSAGQTGETLDQLARRYADLTDARVTLVGLDGTVLGESHEDRLQMDNHLYRVEIQDALAKGEGASTRYSRTLGYDWMYVAVPVPDAGQPLAVMRLAVPLTRIQAGVTRLRTAVLAAMLLATVLAVLLALWIAERAVRPVRSLTAVVQRVADGDLGARMIPTTADELGVLTHAFNRMSEQLRDKVHALNSEQSRLSGVLEHMADGVVITDRDGLVRLLNPAAARLLDTTSQAAMGRSFAQVARHHRIIEVWQTCRERQQEQAAPVEIGLRGGFLQVIATPLAGDQEQSCLVIIQDLTQVRRLETVRRDFISNISHELRTPLASLKALVETLRDGALDDPPAAQRFLEQMDGEVDALTQTVQELLELSRTESGQAPLQLKPASVAGLIQQVARRLLPQAERAGLQLTVDVPESPAPVLADAERVEQALTNLLHNAIKFTPSGGQITLSAREQGGEAIISVRDTGTGIASEDLPRIFERFYKADRARSTSGTGLGLSIAKHIVQAHGGRIWAESVLGQGSTFSIALPLAADRS